MNDYKFGNFFYQLRAEKGLSQSQLGDMIGVSNKAVSKWEMGVSKPRPAMLVTLATLFDISVDELLSGERNAEKKKDEESSNNNVKNDNAIKLLSCEYLKKKKSGKIAIITSILLPFVLFVWVGVITELYPTDKVIGPLVAMVIFFTEAILIVLIFVFYAPARRLKRILYSTYYVQKDEITAIIFPQKEKVPFLKWEKVCSAISTIIVSIGTLLRFIDRNLLILKIVEIIFMVVAIILILIVFIHYGIRVHRIRNRK